MDHFPYSYVSLPEGNIINMIGNQRLQWEILSQVSVSVSENHHTEWISMLCLMTRG